MSLFDIWGPAQGKNVSMPSGIIDRIEKLAVGEGRTFSNMLLVLLLEALKVRGEDKPSSEG